MTLRYSLQHASNAGACGSQFSAGVSRSSLRSRFMCRVFHVLNADLMVESQLIFENEEDQSCASASLVS
jgi:hypothetical protein